MIVRQNAITPIEFAGLRILDYTAGQDGGSSLAVIEVPPGARHAESWSERSDKYYLVVSGTIEFVLGSVVATMAAGDFCLVRKGQHFSYSNQTSDSAHLVLVHTPSFDLRSERFMPL